MSDVMIEGPADAGLSPGVGARRGGADDEPVPAQYERAARRAGSCDRALRVRIHGGAAAGRARKPPPAGRAARAGIPADPGWPRGRVRSGQRLLIGGKSMGGRVASLAADELYRRGRIAGLVCLGIPFIRRTGRATAHRAPRRARVPDAHRAGRTRSASAAAGEIEGYRLSPAIRIAWIGDGDHDLGPRGGSANPQGQPGDGRRRGRVLCPGVVIGPSGGGRGRRARARRRRACRA